MPRLRVQEDQRPLAVSTRLRARRRRLERGHNGALEGFERGRLHGFALEQFAMARQLDHAEIQFRAAPLQYRQAAAQGALELQPAIALRDVARPLAGHWSEQLDENVAPRQIALERRVELGAAEGIAIVWQDGRALLLKVPPHLFELEFEIVGHLREQQCRRVWSYRGRLRRRRCRMRDRRCRNGAPHR